MSLSISGAPEKSKYEVVVIGSGYAGSVAASRLARAGREVALLEKGREWPIGEFPDSDKKYLENYQIELGRRHVGSWDGLYGLNANRDLNVLYGVGLGGGSLINASVAVRCDPRVFDDERWPAEIRAARGAGGGSAFGELERWYALAEDMLRVTTYPEGEPGYPVLKKTEGLRKAAAYMGETFKFAPIHVNFDRLPNDTNHVGVRQTPCNNCGDCFSGCNYTSKNTLYMNYLPDARNHGAHIFTGVMVQYLRPGPDGGWQIVWQRTGRPHPAKEQILEADIVILGAGTLGSSELLLRSREKGLSLSNRVGHGLSGNADLLGFSYNAEQLINGVGFGDRDHKGREPVGPAVTGMIDLREGRDLEIGRVLEEGTLTGASHQLYPALMAATAALLGRDTDSGVWNWIKERWRVLADFAGSSRGAMERTQTLLAISHDTSDGRMVIEGDRLRIRWPGVNRSHDIDRNEQLLYEASEALGATYLPLPKLLRGLPPTVVSGHPLGGCSMGEAAEEGVTNQKGQVFSGTRGRDVHDGLYVFDGGIIPRSVGINPFLTITAFAERSVSLLAADKGWSFNYDY